MLDRKEHLEYGDEVMGIQQGECSGVVRASSCYQYWNPAGAVVDYDAAGCGCVCDCIVDCGKGRTVDRGMSNHEECCSYVDHG